MEFLFICACVSSKKSYARKLTLSLMIVGIHYNIRTSGTLAIPLNFRVSQYANRVWAPHVQTMCGYFGYRHI